MDLIFSSSMSRINDRFITNRNILSIDKINEDVKHNLITGNANDTRFFANFYQKIGLDIVTESVFDYPYPYLTEKTFRPIIEKRIFIILGAKGSIDFLKKQGFETFDNIINEDYDNIEDPEFRLIAVSEEIKKFCQLSIEEVKEYYYNNKEKFEKNYQNLMIYKKNELERIERLINESQ